MIEVQTKLILRQWAIKATLNYNALDKFSNFMLTISIRLKYVSKIVSIEKKTHMH